MLPATLIENLIEAIEAIPTPPPLASGGPLSERIEDAKETAALAKMVLPTIEAPPAAVTAGGWFVLDHDNDELHGSFADEVGAKSWGATALDPQGVDWSVLRGIPPAGPPAGAPLPHARATLPGTGSHVAPPGSHTSPPPANPMGCPDCGATLDAAGDCPDPNCPSNAPAQSYDEAMDELKGIAAGHRPGQVISNKPAGSLYSK